MDLSIHRVAERDTMPHIEWMVFYRYQRRRGQWMCGKYWKAFQLAIPLCARDEKNRSFRTRIVCIETFFFFCPIRLLVNVLLSQDTLGALTNRFIRRQYVSTKSFQFDPPNNSSHRQSESNRKRRNLQSHKLMTHNQISRRALLNDRESHY